MNQPPPMAKRIPEDQPFVVKHSMAKRSLTFLPFIAIFLCLGACMAGSTLASVDPDPGLVVVGLLIVVFGAGFPFGVMWLTFGSAPVLAVGPHGLWIKTRPTRGQAVFLPWEAIAVIERRRWLWEKMVAVTPLDPRATANTGLFTAIDSSVLSAVYGTGMVATMTFADRKEQEILGAIHHFSGGRFPNR